MRIIRRYRNRKLYDASESRYVNLSDLFELVREGNAIKVVNDADEDITVTTLLSAVLERGKELGAELTQEGILKVIQAGDGTLADFLNNSLKEVNSNV